MSKQTTALILGDLQNDFLHPDGAYGRAGQSSPDIAALPARLAPLVRAARDNGTLIVATLFTLVPGRGAEPIISPHLKSLRPFLRKATSRREAGASNSSSNSHRPISMWRRLPTRLFTLRGSNGFCASAASSSSISPASS